MITLNLLDPKRKNNYLFRRILLTIQKGIEVIFFFVLLIGITFSISQYYLEKNLQEVAQQNTFINQNIGEFNQEISRINLQLRKIQEIQDQYLAWTPALLEITKTIPENVKLKSLKINKEAKLVDLQGLAKKRDDLLQLKNNLKNIHFVEKVESPLSNLLKKENIDFQFAIFLNLDRLTYD